MGSKYCAAIRFLAAIPMLIMQYCNCKVAFEMMGHSTLRRNVWHATITLTTFNLISFLAFLLSDVCLRCRNYFTTNPCCKTVLRKGKVAINLQNTKNLELPVNLKEQSTEVPHITSHEGPEGSRSIALLFLEPRR